MSTLDDIVCSRPGHHTGNSRPPSSPLIGESIPKAKADKSSVRKRLSGTKYSHSMQCIGTTELSEMDDFPRNE